MHSRNVNFILVLTSQEFKKKFAQHFQLPSNAFCIQLGLVVLKFKSVSKIHRHTLCDVYNDAACRLAHN